MSQRFDDSAVAVGKCTARAGYGFISLLRVHCESHGKFHDPEGANQKYSFLSSGASVENNDLQESPAKQPLGAISTNKSFLCCGVVLT